MWCMFNWQTGIKKLLLFFFRDKLFCTTHKALQTFQCQLFSNTVFLLESKGTCITRDLKTFNLKKSRQPAKRF